MLIAMPVRVNQRGARSRIAVGDVRDRAERMLLALSLGDAELSILLCDDRVMRSLNRRHRGLDRPTDVLAFSMLEGRPFPGAALLLGDVVISVPYAARQARSAGRDPLAEVTLLLAHGLLHLLGCDHRTRTEERRMWARTDALLAAALGGA
jgi:probable rRNA maturation factor